LIGRTDIEIEISNPCARLLTKYEASGSAKGLALIKKTSPAP
jgi:hypothetical protein